MRHSATRALLERDDVIIVASVSCIYGIGASEAYVGMDGGTVRREDLDAVVFVPLVGQEGWEHP